MRRPKLLLPQRWHRLAVLIEAGRQANRRVEVIILKEEPKP